MTASKLLSYYEVINIYDDVLETFGDIGTVKESYYKSGFAANYLMLRNVAKSTSPMQVGKLDMSRQEVAYSNLLNETYE